MPTLDTPVSSLMPTGSRQWIPNSFSAPVSNKDFSTVITTVWYCEVWLFGCSARCYFSFLLGYSHCYSNASLTARLPLLQRVFTANSPFLTTGLLLFYAEGVWHHSPVLNAAVFNPRYTLCVCYRTHLSPIMSALPTALISSWWTRTRSVSCPQKEVSFPHLLQILGEPSLPRLPGNGYSVRGKLWEQCRQNVACWNKISNK